MCLRQGYGYGPNMMYQQQQMWQQQQAYMAQQSLGSIGHEGRGCQDRVTCIMPETSHPTIARKGALAGKMRV